ncbi:hypothetical protein PtA15_7A430 [Puccinia triticina]|nr:uncharacterized protein PtA15_7A430 [Puccinia triticina]WAQ86702.1 hypothetical protein PtA15_7A430 [Puccinia triticina]WAR56568.1 hypothetical protein PtB15_7B417 [Puccinia triticina]
MAASGMKIFVATLLKAANVFLEDCEARIKKAEETGSRQMKFFDLVLGKDDIEAIETIHGKFFQEEE